MERRERELREEIEQRRKNNQNKLEKESHKEK